MEEPLSSRISVICIQLKLFSRSLGLKIVGNKEIAQADKQIAGVKCSALINKKIDYNKCQRIEHGTRLSSSRDPAFKWAMECPTGMALVALYDQRGFKSLKYGKCCSIESKKCFSRMSQKNVSRLCDCCGTLEEL